MKTGYATTRGLTAEEAKKQQARFGRNELVPQKRDRFFPKLLHVLREPMFLLLLVAAVIYFILGEPRDGLVMLVFVAGVVSIEAVQEWKTDKTLRALRDLSAPRIQVLRDGVEVEIPSADLVPEDVMLIQEGIKIPADGFVIRCADLCVDESSLTGEAEGVWKTAADKAEADGAYWRRDYCYAGTLVTQGTAAILVDKIGVSTEYGRISATIAAATEEATPLQRQIGHLVKISVGIAAVLSVLAGGVTWLNSSDADLGGRLIQSILSGVTLAMAMIPEEFPVILAVFLSMGAWRLAKKNSLVRRLPSVETLGAVSVLCVDKTGTLTKNQMTVQEVWAADWDDARLIHDMGLACETDAYDPMEKAMLLYCDQKGIDKGHLFGGELMGEYAFTNQLKMMGHIWYHDDEIVLAAKGSPESILPLCGLEGEELRLAEGHCHRMGEQGLRVIAVASARPENEAEIPPELTGCRLTLSGLVGLADPPRESVRKDIATCTRAGIRTVMITGDSSATAMAIAKQVGMPVSAAPTTGEMLDTMDDGVLREKVKTTTIFSRVIPQHKMRIVKAFQENGEIVAMTGDGVNDAPALKYADIGIAMGKRGSEVAREAADLILMDDNFSTIVDTVQDGRRIYDNIRKAVGYVFAIHIPIAAASLLAPILGIGPDSLLLLPLHVVLLELIIDPTCSIVLERQPADSDSMQRGPRRTGQKLLSAGLLAKSILQGAVIFGASFGLYYTALAGNPANGPVARSMGLAAIMAANIFLVQVNSSESDSILKTAKKLVRDKVMWGINLFTLLGLGVILYSPLHVFLKLSPLSACQALLVLAVSAASVLWYEGVKLLRRIGAQAKKRSWKIC